MTSLPASSTENPPCFACGDTEYTRMVVGVLIPRYGRQDLCGPCNDDLRKVLIVWLNSRKEGALA